MIVLCVPLPNTKCTRVAKIIFRMSTKFLPQEDPQTHFETNINNYIDGTEILNLQHVVVCGPTYSSLTVLFQKNHLHR